MEYYKNCHEKIGTNTKSVRDITDWREAARQKQEQVDKRLLKLNEIGRSPAERLT